MSTPAPESNEERDQRYSGLDDELSKSQLYQEETPADSESESDVFSPENVPAATLITLLRIYDLLSVIVRENHPEYEGLLEHHAAGGLAGPPPYFLPPEALEEMLSKELPN